MLKVHTKNLETVTILSVEGQIVIGETEILRNFVNTLSETSALILDLARVSRIDAHGLGVMLKLRERTHASGIRLELMNIGKPLSTVLEMARLDSVFQITSGVEFFPAASPERRVSNAALRSCA
jgi:anti-anti-sigma factor